MAFFNFQSKTGSDIEKLSGKPLHETPREFVVEKMKSVAGRVVTPGCIVTVKESHLAQGTGWIVEVTYPTKG